MRTLNGRCESGTKADGDGFQQVHGLIRRREVGVLVVYDQSRLTRGENALAVIRDLVSVGGRFLAHERRRKRRRRERTGSDKIEASRQKCLKPWGKVSVCPNPSRSA